MLLNDSMDEGRGAALPRKPSRIKLGLDPISQSLVGPVLQRKSVGADPFSQASDGTISRLKEQIKERDETITQLSMKINEDSRKITELENIIEEKETLLQEMEEQKNALLNELLSSSGQGSK